MGKNIEKGVKIKLVSVNMEIKGNFRITGEAQCLMMGDTKSEGVKF